MAVVPDATNELIAVLDRLCAADPTQLGDGETVQVLYRQLERLAAATARATAAFEAGRA